MNAFRRFLPVARRQELGQGQLECRELVLGSARLSNTGRRIGGERSIARRARAIAESGAARRQRVQLSTAQGIGDRLVEWPAVAGVVDALRHDGAPQRVFGEEIARLSPRGVSRFFQQRDTAELCRKLEPRGRQQGGGDVERADRLVGHPIARGSIGRVERVELVGGAPHQRHPKLVEPQRVPVCEPVAVLAQRLAVIRCDQDTGSAQRVEAFHQATDLRVHPADFAVIAAQEIAAPERSWPAVPWCIGCVVGSELGILRGGVIQLIGGQATAARVIFQAVQLLGAPAPWKAGPWEVGSAFEAFQ
jgi:hypothetical protein